MSWIVLILASTFQVARIKVLPVFAQKFFYLACKQNKDLLFFRKEKEIHTLLFSVWWTFCASLLKVSLGHLRPCSHVLLGFLSQRIQQFGSARLVRFLSYL